MFFIYCLDVLGIPAALPTDLFSRLPLLAAGDEKTLFLFHLTKIMYIHVYDTGSFSADTGINSTYHMQTEPGRKK